MTAKEYLEQVIKIDERIKSIDDKIKEQRLRINTLSATDYSKNIVQSSGISDISDLIVGMEEHINKLTQEKNRLQILKEDITDTINKVHNNLLASLLIHRYLLNEKWEAVAENINMSKEMTRKELHGQALNEINEIISPKLPPRPTS